MLAQAVRFALALELLLICLEGAIPPLSRLLPLGGSHLAQVGFCLGLGVAGADVWLLYLRLRRDHGSDPSTPPSLDQ